MSQQKKPATPEEFFKIYGHYKRCGITQRGDERKKEWERDVYELTNWWWYEEKKGVIKRFNSKKEAQEWENSFDGTWQKWHGGGKEGKHYCGYTFHHKGDKPK